jgi:hypothetical protein
MTAITRLREGADHFGQGTLLAARGLAGCVSRKIALRENADEPSTLIYDGNASDLVPRHLVHALADRFARVARHDAIGHAIRDDRRSHVTSAPDDTQDDIAIGYDAREHTVIAHNRQRAAIEVCHQPHRMLNGARRMHARNALRHQLVHLKLIKLRPRIEGTRIAARLRLGVPLLVPLE